MKILLVDNYDSFTWNLHHYLDEAGAKVTVIRNNHEISDISDFQAAVLSPGPGLPETAGTLMQTTTNLIENHIPVLGVCLGMQAIAQFFNASLYNLSQPVHGRPSLCTLTVAQDPLFQGIPKEFQAGRYHSWAVHEPLPDPLLPLARTHDGILMAMKHDTLPVHAVQFHPESILTPHGKQLLKNWMNIISNQLQINVNTIMSQPVLSKNQ